MDFLLAKMVKFLIVFLANKMEDQTLSKKAWEEYLRTKKYDDMISLCQIIQHDKSWTFPHDFFKNLVVALGDYFILSLKNDCCLVELHTGLIPMFKVFHESYKLNISTLDVRLLEKIKEYVKKIISQPVPEGTCQDQLLDFLVVVFELFDIIMELKIITGIDEKLLYFTYNFYQNTLFYMFSSPELKKVFLTPFVPTEKLLQKVLGDREEILDLMLYSLINIKKISEKINNLIDPNLTLFFGNLLKSVNEIQDFYELVCSQNSALALKKSQQILLCLKILFGKTAKKENLRVFLSSYFERFKETFYLNVVHCLKYLPISSCLSFKKDSSPLGLIFTLACRIFADKSYNEDLEAHLLSLLSLIMNQDFYQPLPLLLCTYILQFIQKYFKNLGLRTSRSTLLNNQDAGLVSLLFHKDLFYCGSLELAELSFKARHIWGKIWHLLCRNPKNFQWLSHAITVNIHQYFYDFMYIVKVKEWIVNELHMNEKFIQECLKFGFLEKNIDTVKGNAGNIGISDNVLALFQIIYSILNVKELFVGINPSGITRLLCDVSLVENKNFIDIGMKCIGEILKIPHCESFLIVKSFFEKLSQGDLLLKYVQAMKGVLKGLGKGSEISILLCKIGWFGAVKQKFLMDLPSVDKENQMKIWEELLEVVMILLEDNEFTQRVVGQLEFEKIAMGLRESCYDETREKICENGISTVFRILYDRKNIDHDQKIRVPEVIPLVITMLMYASECETMENARIRFKSLLTSPNSLPYFAKFSCVQIALYYFKYINLPCANELFQKVLQNVIPYSILPQELAQLIELIANSPTEKTIYLLHCLEQAVTNSFIEGKNMALMAKPTKFIYFRKKKYFCCQLSEEKMPKKGEFTLFFWLYISKIRGKISVAELIDKSNKKLKIKLRENGVSVTQTEGKKKFSALAEVDLKPNTWNFIGISIRSQKVSKLLKSKECISFYFSNSFLPMTIKGSLSPSIGNFKFLYLGKTSKHSKILDGRISSFSISNVFYTAEHFELLSRLSPLYMSEYNSSTLCMWRNLRIEKNIVFDSVVFSCTPFTASSQDKTGVHMENDCEKFNGISIIESIVCIGGLKVLLTLIDLENFNEALVLPVLKTLLQVIKCKEVWVLIDSKFINLLGYILNTLPSTSAITEYVFKIAISLNTNIFQQEYLKNIQLSEKFSTISVPDRLKFLNLYISLIKRSFGCTKESVFMLFNYVKDFANDSEFFCNTFSGLVPEQLDIDSVKGINLVNYIAPECIVFGLIQLFIIRNVGISPDTPIEIMLFYILDKFADCKGRVQTISLLLLRTFREDLNRENEVKEAERTCKGIENALQERFDSELGREIIEFIAKNKKKMIKTSPGLLCSIVTKKLQSKLEGPEAILNSILDFSNKLAKMIYKSRCFPEWVIISYTLYPASLQILNTLAVSLVVLQPKLKNFSKVRVFLTQIAKNGVNALEIYQKILSALKLTCNQGKIFLDFCILLEDILPKSLDSHIKLYKTIIKDLFSTTKSLKLLKCSTPGIPSLQISEIRTLLKSRPKKKTLSDEVYLKEGGFFRIFLKFLLIGISIDDCADYLNMLEEILFTIESSQLEGKFLLFSEGIVGKAIGIEYFHLYLFCEIVEIFYFTKNPASLFVDFLLIFLLDFKIYEKLFELINGITKEDFVSFRMLLAENVGCLYPTWRSYCSIEARGRLNELLPNLDALTANVMHFSDDLTYFKIFVGKMSEKMLQFREALDNSEVLLGLLRSKEWISDIHIYLLACLSVRMNLISASSENYKYTKQPIPTDYLPAYHKSLENMIFIKNTQDQWIRETNEIQSRSKISSTFKYKKFKNTLKDLENVLADSDTKTLKIRICSDNSFRHMFTKTYLKDKSPQESFISPSNPSKLFESYYESLIESSENDLEIVEVEEEIEDVPDVQSTSVECERIRISGSVYGKLEVDKKYLAFFSDGTLKPESDEYIGSALNYTRERKVSNCIWDINEISEVIPRRFIHRATAVEVFMKSGKSYFFNTFSKSSRKILMDGMKAWTDSGVIVHSHISVKQILPYMSAWKKGTLSNFDYIMILNKYCNRSINDMSQYPIFPWVLTDYESENLDLADEKIYRDLSCPIGSLLESSRVQAKKRYEMISAEENMEPFHYGTHYSSGSNSSYFLIRLEPFTTEARKIQNNSFDKPDRLFHSIQSAWNSCLSINSDVKELIPEFFYFPDFLKNFNSLDLGLTQSGKDISNVNLPPWAKSSITNFIKIHRQALESNFVSKNLHNWIDLIFGYKQQGQAAIESINVFTPASYINTFEKVAKINGNVQGIIDEAYHFGQVPSMLFSKPHEKKEEKERKTPCCKNFFSSPSMNFECACINLEKPGKIHAFLMCGKTVMVIKSQGQNFFLLKIKANKLSEEVQMQNFALVEPSLWPPSYYWKGSFPEDISMVLDFGGNIFCIFQEKYLISALHIDSSLRIHTLDGVLFMSLFIHPGLVSSVTCTAKYIFSGGLGCTIISWDTNSNYLRYLGHKYSIRQIQASESFQVLVSLDCAGTILLHDLRTAECLKKITSSCSRPPKAFALSELGVIAVAFTEDKILKFFSLNGSEVWEPKEFSENAWCLRFDKSGEYLACGTTESITIIDVFNGNKFRVEVESTVMDVAVLPDEEGIGFVLHQPIHPKIYFMNFN